MDVMRLSDAQPYIPAAHHGVQSLRLQAPGGSDTAPGVAVAYFLPGGGAEREASPTEKTYVLLEGELDIVAGDQQATLRPLDCCRIAAGEARSIHNPTPRPASLLVILAAPTR